MTTTPRLAEVIVANFDAAIGLKVYLGLGFGLMGEMSGDQRVGELDPN
jgi:hypothetical protein